MRPAIKGPHAGTVLASLPLSDLAKPDGGMWRAKPKWMQSGLDTFDGKPVIRAFHKAGSGTSDHPHKDANGVCVKCKAPSVCGSQGAVVAFDIYFDPARWQWSRGGKIGGIFVGEGKASGGRHVPDGASHRLMFQADGGAISYCYFPAGYDQPNVPTKGRAMGEGYHHALFAKAFKPGRWHRVEIGLKNNTFAKDGTPNADGVASLTIDGKTGRLNGVVWSLQKDTRLSGFELSSFFGGPDPALVDSVYYATNFTVHEWRD